MSTDITDLPDIPDITEFASIVYAETMYDFPPREPIRNLPSKLRDVTSEMKTYQIQQYGCVHDIRMPRSKTFDSCTETPIEYTFTQIYALKQAIGSLLPGSNVPSSRYVSIINYLDLQPKIISQKFSNGMEAVVSIVGSTLHGQSIFTKSGVITTLTFNYGLLDGEQALRVQPFEYKSEYRNGRLILTPLPWETIIEMISNPPNNDREIYMALYMRLLSDGVTGEVTRLNRDITVIRHDIDTYEFVFKDLPGSKRVKINIADQTVIIP